MINLYDNFPSTQGIDNVLIRSLLKFDLKKIVKYLGYPLFARATQYQTRMLSFTIKMTTLNDEC